MEETNSGLSRPRTRYIIMHRVLLFLPFVFFSVLSTCFPAHVAFGQEEEVVRVFIFAGQSNMVGSDSHVEDISSFPPFAGLENPQDAVRFSYCIGRENKQQSEGWTSLQPIGDIVGPELSFARKVTAYVDAPVAIIKCAAGGTHLGGDWNPDEPSGFEMYPLCLARIREALKQLDDQGVLYRIEGFMWHQGENDMFEQSYMENYGTNLANFISCWRRDLERPKLPFYIGELCTKTIWGMDLRPRMFAISEGQKQVCRADTKATYVPTSHVGVEIGNPVGLHYHYGTLGQLEHGENYADAYLNSLGIETVPPRNLENWPFEAGSKVKLFVMAGHRNMEGERAFVQDVANTDAIGFHDHLQNIPFRYSIGGGYKVSQQWEPLGPAGFYDTFGPEVSFAHLLDQQLDENIVIAKFTHSGSQIIDWTPEGSIAHTRNLYPDFIEFVKASIAGLENHGHEVDFAGIFYHVGENDMSFFPFREKAAERVHSFVTRSRIDLEMPELKWFVSQQAPTDHENVNRYDPVPDFVAMADEDEQMLHIRLDQLQGQEKRLVISTPGIIELGEVLARAYLDNR